jgi:hypothetical protein
MTTRWRPPSSHGSRRFAGEEESVTIALWIGLGMQGIEIETRLDQRERSGHECAAHRSWQNFFLEGFTPKIRPRALLVDEFATSLGSSAASTTSFGGAPALSTTRQSGRISLSSNT